MPTENQQAYLASAAGMGALLQDARMRKAPPAWNGKLAIFAGFTPIFDTADP